ncbi:MAG: peptidase S1 [Pseudomonadota bacterium]
MRGLSWILALAAFAILGGQASAQTLGQPPTHGSVTLSAGFPTDPYSVRISAGGTIDARQTLGGNCRGLIDSPPNFQLLYNAGRVYPLHIFVQSAADTTLVINDPDGNWRCNDDGMGNLNPLITFVNPPSGRYDIWVGTFWTGSEPRQATLFISELTP